MHGECVVAKAESSTRRLGGLRIRIRVRIPRQPVVREHVPRRLACDKRAVRGPNSGVVVQRAEPDRDLGAVWPEPSEKPRPADLAERLRRAPVRAIDANQVIAAKKPEALARDAALRQAERP